MKRYLDEFFINKMNNGDYVICADVGYFPESRKHKNFIDVGNSEASVGAIADGLLCSNHNVYIYDMCGYVLRNSYSSLYNRKSKFLKNSHSHLFIFSWGSGFFYDGCGFGHNMFDDITLANLIGLNIHNPDNENDIFSYNHNEDTYIRLFDLEKYNTHNIITSNEGFINIIALGWIKYEIIYYLARYNNWDRIFNITNKADTNRYNIEVSDQYFPCMHENSHKIIHPNIHDNIKTLKDFENIVLEPEFKNFIKISLDKI